MSLKRSLNSFIFMSDFLKDLCCFLKKTAICFFLFGGKKAFAYFGHVKT